MRKAGLRRIVVVAVVVGVLWATLLVADAGWFFNARLDVEDVDVRTVWTVVDDQTGQSLDSEVNAYSASITVTLPREADAEVEEVARNETVVLKKSKKLECKSDGIEAEVVYRVAALGQVDGNKVVVTITADGEYVDSATGHLDQNIKLQVLIPADEPECDD